MPKDLIIPNGTVVISRVDNDKEGKIEGKYPEGYKIRWSKRKFDYSYRKQKDFTIKNNQ